MTRFDFGFDHGKEVNFDIERGPVNDPTKFLMILQGRVKKLIEMVRNMAVSDPPAFDLSVLPHEWESIRRDVRHLNRLGKELWDYSLLEELRQQVANIIGLEGDYSVYNFVEPDNESEAWDLSVPLYRQLHFLRLALDHLVTAVMCALTADDLPAITKDTQTEIVITIEKSCLHMLIGLVSNRCLKVELDARETFGATIGDEMSAPSMVTSPEDEEYFQIQFQSYIAEVISEQGDQVFQVCHACLLAYDTVILAAELYAELVQKKIVRPLTRPAHPLEEDRMVLTRRYGFQPETQLDDQLEYLDAPIKHELDHTSFADFLGMASVFLPDEEVSHLDDDVHLFSVEADEGAEPGEDGEGDQVDSNSVIDQEEGDDACSTFKGKGVASDDGDGADDGSGGADNEEEEIGPELLKIYEEVTIRHKLDTEDPDYFTQLMMIISMEEAEKKTQIDDKADGGVAGSSNSG